MKQVIESKSKLFQRESWTIKQMMSRSGAVPLARGADCPLVCHDHCAGQLARAALSSSALRTDTFRCSHTFTFPGTVLSNARPSHSPSAAFDDERLNIVLPVARSHRRSSTFVTSAILQIIDIEVQLSCLSAKIITRQRKRLVTS